MPPFSVADGHIFDYSGNIIHICLLLSYILPRHQFLETVRDGADVWSMRCSCSFVHFLKQN